MAQSDNTMVLKSESGEVLARASLSEDLAWSVSPEGSGMPAEFADDFRDSFQGFTDDELDELSPANGEPQAVLLQRTAEAFDWEVETIQPSQMRSDATP